MYYGKKIATLVGDRATVKVYRLTSLVSDLVRFKIEDEVFAEVENPRGVRIVEDQRYALTLAAALAQEGRIG
jgi:hypothetical protein